MSVCVFLHGLESSDKGTKAVFFREHFPEIIIPNFQGGLRERMKKLQGVLVDVRDIKFVGSSFGGLMASIFAMDNEARVNRLILLAPALNLMEFSDYTSRQIAVPVEIFHGVNDDVIPIETVERIAVKSFLNCKFHKVDDDHFLHNTFKAMDWHNLLGD